MQLACTLAIRVCWIMKSMNKVIVGETIFRRGVNPSTRVLEYSIKELGNGVQVDEPEPERVSNEPLPTPEILPGADAYSDVAYLYTGYPESIVACDICEIWHHSRCSGIEDAEAVPPLFVCSHKGRLFRKVVS